MNYKNINFESEKIMAMHRIQIFFILPFKKYIFSYCLYFYDFLVTWIRNAFVL